jgi:drug/metabolite transporter (DMT)-like permease
VLVMLNPGSALFRLEAAAPLFSALCYSMIPILNRKIGLSEHAITMVLYTTVTFLVLCLMVSSVIHAFPLAPSNGGLVENLLQRWLLPSPADLVLIGVSGAIFTLAILCITQAYRIAIVSTIAPFEYSYLVWASLLGYLVFGDIPNLRTVAGGVAVVACGCYVLYRERIRPAI